MDSRLRVDAPVQSLSLPDALNSPSTANGEINLLQVCADPVFNFGGVGLIVMRVIEGLPACYNVTLASPDANRDNLPKHLQQRVGQLIRTPAYKWSAAASRDFIRRLRSERYDLIHLHGGTLSFDAHLPWRSPLYSLSRLGVPWVFSNHCAPALTVGLFPERYPVYLRPFKAMVAYASLAWLMAACPRQIFDSRENEQRIARYFPWARGKFMTIYHSGLEGEPPRSEMRQNVVTIANLGHISERKGQLDLLEAFCLLLPKFPQLKLLLVGPGENEEWGKRIKTEIARRGLESHVSLPGAMEDLKALWDQVDIYVQPSHLEGAPMSLMEALWHGKPSIGTRVSGIPEIIDHEVNGLLVEPKNPAALAAALERLILAPELRRDFARAAASGILAKKMTRAHMVNRHLSVYAELLRTRHART